MLLLLLRFCFYFGYLLALPLLLFLEFAASFALCCSFLCVVDYPVSILLFLRLLPPSSMYMFRRSCHVQYWYSYLVLCSHSWVLLFNYFSSLLPSPIFLFLLLSLFSVLHISVLVLILHSGVSIMHAADRFWVGCVSGLFNTFYYLIFFYVLWCDFQKFFYR